MMGRVFKRLFITLVVLVIIAGGAVWWLLRYIAPDQQLNLNYSPIDVKQKALDMVKALKPELVLTEEDVNNLIKKHIHTDVAENVLLNGAQFHLRGDRLVADLNVTYRDRIPAQLQAEYRMEWQEPNLVLLPQSLSLKEFNLPVDWLDIIKVPLDIPAVDVFSLHDIQFEMGQIKVIFKINLPF